MEQLLSTKLFIPTTRTKLVSRPRLIELINRGLNRKLTLISAPAGYGKTTLITEWVEQLRSAGPTDTVRKNIVAWLSLDESDNDLGRFLTYFIAALKHADGIETNLGNGAMSMLHSPQPAPTKSILTALINEIAEISSRVILILDDYHLIASPSIDDAINFFLEYLPPQFHLVISTRVDPNLPLSRLRVNGELNELRAINLRFDKTEAIEFLNQVMNLDLSKEDGAELESRTEGWIAGLQLAAISIRGSDDASQLIKAFTGSHHLILDYLIEEVLDHQSESMQNFLLKTSILNRMTGELCNAVTGQDNGQATLETLEANNLFIIPLDEKRCSFRYHPLFGDLLRQRLNQTQAEQLPILHRKAAEWYEQAESVDEAIAHALKAQDVEWAANLIEKTAESVWGRGEHTKLQRWLEMLPVDSVSIKPYLCIFDAWYLYANGYLDESERVLLSIEHILDISSDQSRESRQETQARYSKSERLKLTGRIAAIRAFLSRDRGDVPAIIQHAHKALEYLPERDLTWRSIVAIVLGDAHGLGGDMKAAYEARREAVKACKAAGNVYWLLAAGNALALTMRWKGMLEQVIDLSQRHMEIASEIGISATGAVGMSLAISGEAMAELNDLEGGSQRVKKGIELGERGKDLVAIGWGYLCLTRILYSSGDIAGVENIIWKVKTLAQEFDVPPWISYRMTTWQVRIWLAQGKLEDAVQWAHNRGLSPDGDLTYQNEREYITLARILLAQEQLGEANKLLQRLVETTEGREHTARTIEVLLLQTISMYKGGKIDQAMTAFEKAISLAEPCGFIQIFVDEGPLIAQLLYKAMALGVNQDYISRLLAAFPGHELDHTGTLHQEMFSAEMIEPLTDREIEVLSFIAEGLTNQEIASRLFISLNTVKVHARNIFQKLGTSNRTEAAVKAKALGILKSK